METNEALLDRARGGDREAFDLFVAEFDRRLEQVIDQRLGAHLRRSIGVDDVKQETLLRAFRALGGYEWHGEASFLGWLRSIAEHVILKQHDRMKRRPALSLEHDVPGGSTTPSRVLRREERFERLHAALEKLSPEYREVIILSRIEKLPAREIGRRMNRSPEAVASLLFRAIGKLREKFGDTESFHLPGRELDVERLLNHDSPRPEA